MSMTLSGNGTITGLVSGGLPDGTITQAELTTGVAGTGPAFSAYRNTGQTVSNNVTTKLQVNTEEFDTNNNYDNSTNYRFTPTVAGYYQISFGAYASASSVLTLNYVELYKNGATLAAFLSRAGSYTYTPSYAFADGTAGGSILLYFNGSTDYVELYGRAVGTGTLTYEQASFQGVLVRGA